MVSISYGHGKLYDFGSDFLFKGATVYTTTAQGGVGNDTTIAAALVEADDYWNGCYIKFLSATNSANINIIREITNFVSIGATLTHDAFPARTENGDTFVLSVWNNIDNGDGLPVCDQDFETPVCLHGDYMDLESVGGHDAKLGYLTTEGFLHTRTALGINTDDHTKIRYRYRCAGTAKARIVAVFSTYDYGETEEQNITDLKAQEILDDTTSATMTSATITLTAARTLNHLRFYCNNADDHVYYDFALIYTDDFTFPNGAYGISGTLPNTNMRLQIPSRQTRINQMLGSDDFSVRIGCDLTKGHWTKDGLSVKAGTAYVEGQVFYDIIHNAKDEPWQWLNTEREQMKVTLDPWNFNRHAMGEAVTDRVDLDFYEYRLSDAGNSLETYVTRWGLNL